MGVTKSIIFPIEERKVSNGDSFSDTLEQLEILDATMRLVLVDGMKTGLWNSVTLSRVKHPPSQSVILRKQPTLKCLSELKLEVFPR